MNIIESIREKAKKQQKRIVLPETEDERVLQAAAYLTEQDICKVTLVGDKQPIQDSARKKGMTLPDGITYMLPEDDDHFETYAKSFYIRRQHKGITMEEARETIKQPLFYGASLVAHDAADACVGGSIATTGNVLRAAILAIGLKPDSNVVSSTFLMSIPDGRVFTYGDCAVVPYPNVEQLASIATDSAETHEKLTGESPYVGMLSFSTKGSAKHERVDLVLDALELAKKYRPMLKIDGEFQFDAALLPEIAKRKAPKSDVAGKCNVFIYPNLDAGNIAYKITERLGGATATGPIIQGLRKPMMDLSRGCSWEDIVNTAAVSAIMA